MDSPGKMKGRHLLTQQKTKAAEAADATLGRYAVVAAVSGDLVAVREAGDASDGGQLIAKAALPVAVDDPGILLPVLGGGYVFLPIGAASPSGLPLTGGTLTGLLTVQMNGTKFQLNSLDGTKRLAVDGGSLVLANGQDLIGATDDGSTQTWSIDTATGNGAFGTLTGKAFNSPVFAIETQDNPTDSSNTSNSVYDTNVEASITLPTGTWTIYAFTVGAYTNASVASVRQRTRIGASSAGSSWQMLCDSGLPVTFVTNHELAGQTGTVTVYCQYQPVTNGQTVTAKGGSVFIMAVRTA